MYTTGGAEVFNVEAAQEAEVKIPTPPPRQSKSRNVKREAKEKGVKQISPEIENHAPAAAVEASRNKKKELPVEVESALALLDSGNNPEKILPGVTTLIDYAESFRDFRRQCPDEARAIQRKGFKLLEMKHSRLQAPRNERPH